MMRADASLHPDQARRQAGKSRLDLATRPFLPQYDRTTLIVPHDVEQVLADIDADHGDGAIRLLRHSVLLVFAAPGQILYWRGWSTAGSPTESYPSGAWSDTISGR